MDISQVDRSEGCVTHFDQTYTDLNMRIWSFRFWFQQNQYQDVKTRIVNYDSNLVTETVMNHPYEETFPADPPPTSG